MLPSSFSNPRDGGWNVSPSTISTPLLCEPTSASRKQDLTHHLHHPHSIRPTERVPIGVDVVVGVAENKDVSNRNFRGEDAYSEIIFHPLAQVPVLPYRSWYRETGVGLSTRQGLNEM